MIVTDTGPIQYLILLNQENLLPRLFESVLIPYEVSLELAHSKTPDRVKRWMRASPSWAVIETPAPKPVSTGQLHEGELAAIRLVERHPGSLLLIDDLAGKQEAQSRGLKTVGTLEILYEAGSQDLLDFERVLGELLTTNFRLSAKVTDLYRRRWAAHKEHLKER